MAAYEDAIRPPRRREAPWYVVPADNKWFTRLVVPRRLATTLEALDLRYPRVGPEVLARLEAAKRELG